MHFQVEAIDGVHRLGTRGITFAQVVANDGGIDGENYRVRATDGNIVSSANQGPVPVGARQECLAYRFPCYRVGGALLPRFGNRFYKDSMKVLVVGKGGREHALVWKLAQSPRV